VMEVGNVNQLFRRPFHPYTLGLQNAFPNVHGPKQELISIPGSPPKLVNPPLGCRFAQRCPFAVQLCSEQEPAMVDIEDGHQVCCHRLQIIEQMRAEAARKETWDRVAATA